jgi:hypothetical protein
MSSVVLILALALLQGEQLREIVFPGRIACVKSPNGKYEICNLNASDTESEKTYNHALVLRNLKTGDEDIL